MTWYEFRQGLSPRAVEPEPDHGTSVPDVLLQVVLPIVLILAFFALTSAKTFQDRRQEVETLLEEVEALRRSMQGVEDVQKRQAELEEKQNHLIQKQRQLDQQAEELEQQAEELDQQTEELDQKSERLRENSRHLEEWWQEVRTTDPAALGEQLSEAFIEIQRQRLVAALEKVETARRTELGLPSLEKRKVRIDDSGQLVDDGQIFNLFCKRIDQVFPGDEVNRREISDIHRRVLEEAGIVDSYSVRSEPVVVNSAVVADGQRARSGKLTDANRDFLHESIHKFLADLRLDAVEVQKHAVYGILVYYNNTSSEALYRWIPDLEDLRESLVEVARRGGNTAPFEKAIRDLIYRQIRSDFEKHECFLLNDVTEHE